MHPELVLSIVLFQIKLHLVLQLGFGVYNTIVRAVAQHGRDDELRHAYRRSIWS